MRRKNTKGEVTREQAIQELQTISEMLDGKTPTITQFIEYSSIKYRFKQQFPSYGEFCEAAGLPCNVVKESAVKDSQLDKRRQILVAELITKHREHPDWPISQLMNSCSFSRKRIYEVIGHAKEVKQLLDMPYEQALEMPREEEPARKRRSNAIDSEEVLQDMVSIINRYPGTSNVADLLKKHGKYGSGTYFDRFGTVSNMKRIAKIFRPINKERKYDIKYSAAPITLKWMRKRSLNTLSLGQKG